MDDPTPDELLIERFGRHLAFCLGLDVELDDFHAYEEWARDRPWTEAARNAEFC